MPTNADASKTLEARRMENGKIIDERYEQVLAGSRAPAQSRPTAGPAVAASAGPTKLPDFRPGRATAGPALLQAVASIASKAERRKIDLELMGFRLSLAEYCQTIDASAFPLSETTPQALAEWVLHGLFESVAATFEKQGASKGQSLMAAAKQCPTLHQGWVAWENRLARQATGRIGLKRS